MNQRFNVGVDVEPDNDTQGNDDQEQKDLANVDEDTRRYIGNLQRENAELKKRLNGVGSDNAAEDSDNSSTNSDDDGSKTVNTNLNQSDLTLTPSDGEVKGLDIAQFKVEMVENGSLSPTSIDTLEQALSKGLTPEQAKQVTGLLKDNLQLNSQFTQQTVQSILVDIDFKTTLRPWARSQPRYNEWAAGLKTQAWQSVLRDMVNEYRSANGDSTKSTTVNPTSVSGSSAGSGRVTDQSASPEDRGYFINRSEKSQWMRKNGERYRKDPTVRRQYEQMLNESHKRGTFN